MDYGPAPERDAEARKWLASRTAAQFGHFIGGAWTQAGQNVRVIDPSTGAALARVSQGTKADVDAAVAAARTALPAWRGSRRPRARAPPVRARARGAEALAPARRAREHGQRQVDSRDARPRHPARRAALLPSRRLGAAARERVRRIHVGRRHRPDHSVELPAADAGVEGRAGARGGEHGRAQAGGVHAAHRAAVRRDRARRRDCPRACSTS